jgi:hypothetical protein
MDPALLLLIFLPTIGFSAGARQALGLSRCLVKAGGGA